MIHTAYQNSFSVYSFCLVVYIDIYIYIYIYICRVEYESSYMANVYVLSHRFLSKIESPINVIMGSFTKSFNLNQIMD